MHDFHDVLEFHKRYELPCSEFSTLPNVEVFNFRWSIMQEEVNEFDDAFRERNLVGVVDALLDIVYVGLGTAFFIGAPRSGPQSTWPTFRTACMAMANHGVISLTHMPPQLLTLELTRYSIHQMRSCLDGFRYVYEAELKAPDQGGLELMLVCLKNYVDEAYKAATMMHVPWEACWRHVQCANMKKKRAKRDGSDSKRRSEWDVVKPIGFVRPEAKIATELMLQGWHPPVNMRIDNIMGRVEMGPLVMDPGYTEGGKL
jgi:hypothetical protein